MNNIKNTFLKQKNFIRQKAFQYWNKNKTIPFDDFISECHFVFLSCYEKYNPQKGKFKTYLGKALDNRLSVFVYYEQNKYHKQILSTNLITIDKYDIYFEDWINRLSIEAKKIIEIILNEPLQNIQSKKGTITKESLKIFLRQNNWKYNVILFCFNEISRALKNKF